MRSLSFGTEQVDKDRFDILYGGACVSSRGVARTELNTFNSVMKKLEEISKPITSAPEQALVKFELGDEGGTVLLEESEYKLLNEMHDPVKWAKSHTVMAEEAYNWYKAVEKTTLKKVKDSITEEREPASTTEA